MYNYCNWNGLLVDASFIIFIFVGSDKNVSQELQLEDGIEYEYKVYERIKGEKSDSEKSDSEKSE